MSTSFDLSSNCYVKYCITAKRKKGGRESFYKLREMLEDLIDKYGVRSAYESTRGEDALDLDEHNKICICGLRDFRIIFWKWPMRKNLKGAKLYSAISAAITIRPMF